MFLDFGFFVFLDFGCCFCVLAFCVCWIVVLCVLDFMFFVFSFFVFWIFQSSLVSTKNKSEFGCTEAADFTDGLQGFRGMVCRAGEVTIYIHIYLYILIDGQDG